MPPDRGGGNSRIPNDIAILGVDNDETICKLSAPTLSSLSQGVERGGCGVARLATIHAANVEELQAKPLYQELLAGRVFRQAVLIRTGPEGRLYAVENLP